MNSKNTHSRVRNQVSLRTACVVAVLALPLVACSERPADTDKGSAEVSAQQAARDKEVERREGKEQPPVPASQAEAGDASSQYSTPRESWTGGATAQDAGFKSSAENDALAKQLLEHAFHERAGMGAIEVDVEDGVAVLRGKVGSALERVEAEALAEKLEAVLAVRNELEIAPGPD